MANATVTGGNEAWVGSGAPNATHLSKPGLKVHSLAAFAFVKRHTPVPQGDGVSVGTLSAWVAQDATGTFVLTARRVADAPDWGDLTWNNMPGVTGSSQPTATVTNPKAGDRIDWDVATHLSTIAGGSKHYGWRIESNQATDLWLVGDDSENTPSLYAEWHAIPATPTDLTPSGTVDVGSFVVSATADDVTGEDEVTAVQWQIDPASNATAPAFDSGWVTADALELDLSTTAYAGLADAATTYQRCRWANQTGTTTPSGWSDWYPITRKSFPAATLNYPATDGLVHDLTPILLATVDATVDHFRFRVVDPSDPSNVLTSSGKKRATGTTASWEVPENVLADGETYVLQLDTWDDDTRVPSPGHRRYLRTTRSFTIDEVNTVATPVLVSVQPHATLPANVLTVTTSTPPDTFTVYQDGASHEAKIDAVSVFVSGTTYQILDYDFTYMDAHTYAVRSVQDGNRSPKSNTLSLANTPGGVWVVDPATGDSFMLAGTGIDDWGRVDVVGQYQVHGADLQVIIEAGSSGYTGTFKGAMQDAVGRTLADMRKDLQAIQKRGTKPVLVRCANFTKWVTLLDLSDSPHPDTQQDAPMDQVSFRMVQAPKPSAGS